MVGIGAPESAVPPDASSYHFNVLLPLAVAVSAVVDTSSQMSTGLVTVRMAGVGLTVAVIKARGPSQPSVVR